MTASSFRNYRNRTPRDLNADPIQTIVCKHSCLQPNCTLQNCIVETPLNRWVIRCKKTSKQKKPNNWHFKKTNFKSRKISFYFMPVNSCNWETDTIKQLLLKMLCFTWNPENTCDVLFRYDTLFVFLRRLSDFSGHNVWGAIIKKIKTISIKEEYK